jgi:hypothetical protein
MRTSGNLKKLSKSIILLVFTFGEDKTQGVVPRSGSESGQKNMRSNPDFSIRIKSDQEFKKYQISVNFWRK